MNPGPSMAPMAAAEIPARTAPTATRTTGFERFGLMAAPLRRWAKRLPQALALGAGEHVQIPPGNRRVDRDRWSRSRNQIVRETAMHFLFANTGVQIVCVPLAAAAAAISAAADRLRLAAMPTAAAARRRDRPGRIPTSSGRSSSRAPRGCSWPSTPPAAIRELGYFCDAERADQGLHRSAWRACWTCRASRCGACRPIELCIRPATATAGDAKHVHMVVDFGNSRTGALLLEMAGEIAQTPQMMPFELVNRYHLDAWNEEGEYVSMPAARWFSSKTHWCNTPYLPPLPQKKTEYHTVRGRGRRRLVRPRQAQAEADQGRGDGHAAAVRRPLHGPHGPRGRRRGAGDAGRGRHPHRRQLAEALPLGRRRQLAGRGQLVHGRSGRPLQDGRLRRDAPRAASCDSSTRTTATSCSQEGDPQGARATPRRRR